MSATLDEISYVVADFMDIQIRATESEDATELCTALMDMVHIFERWNEPEFALTALRTTHAMASELPEWKYLLNSVRKFVNDDESDLFFGFNLTSDKV